MKKSHCIKLIPTALFLFIFVSGVSAQSSSTITARPQSKSSTAVDYKVQEFTVQERTQAGESFTYTLTHPEFTQGFFDKWSESEKWCSWGSMDKIFSNYHFDAANKRLTVTPQANMKMNDEILMGYLEGFMQAVKNNPQGTSTK